MIRTLILALFVVTLSACGSSAATGPQGAVSDAAGNGAVSEVTARGGELFAANCAACHGVSGATGTASGPPLVHIVYEPSHHGDLAFHRAVREGVAPHHWDFGPMPPVSGLSDADIEDIIGYVREQQRAAGIE